MPVLLVHRMILVVLLLCAGGCAGSRWARKDPDYAEKYSRHSDDPLQMAKQAMDARHLEKKSGMFYAANVQPHPSAVGAEVGSFTYLKPWLEEQLAIAGLFSDDLDDVFVGGKVAARIQSPSRVAPFVGVGGFAGLFHKGTAHDFAWLMLHDPDHRDWNPGDDGLHPMFAVYPEAGIHWWLDSEVRLTASLSYYITTEGRDHDYLFLTFAVSQLKLDDFIPRGGQRHFERTPTSTDESRVDEQPVGLSHLPPVE